MVSLISLRGINVKTMAFGNKEHTTDQKMGVSVLLRRFISNNEITLTPCDVILQVCCVQYSHVKSPPRLRPSEGFWGQGMRPFISDEQGNKSKTEGNRGTKAILWNRKHRK